MTNVEQATSADSAALAAKIRKQVEFYFSDANLPRDKFLLEQVSNDSEGFVDLSVIASFARMKKLTEDQDVVKAALEESTELVLSEDGKRVRRASPLPDTVDNMSRSLHVQNLSMDAELDDVEAFFADICKAANIPAPAAIRFKRDLKTKDFTGSAFVEMAADKDAVVLMEHISGNPTNYAEGLEPMVVQTKLAYFEGKNAERIARQIKSAEERRTSVLDRYGRGRLVKAVFKPIEITADADATAAVDTEEETEAKEEAAPIHETIKAALKDSFPVAYVDFDFTPGNIWLRFTEPVAASFVTAHGAEGFKADSFALEEIVTPSEDEEFAYYDAMMQSQGASRNGHKKNFNKRSNSRSDEQQVASDAKKAKTDE